MLCFAAGIISAVEIVTPERALPLPAAVEARCELAVFPVEAQEFYTVELITAASPEAGYVLRVDFFDRDGRDIAVLEKTLSIRESNIRAEGRAGQRILRAGTTAGSAMARPVLGKVTLEPAGKLTVESLKITRGVPENGSLRAASGVVQVKATGNFSANLLADPSFEEVDSTGKLRRWSMTGSGNPAEFLSRESYAGEYSLKLRADRPEVQFVSEIFPVDPALPVQMMYFTRFSSHAVPRGHADPVRIEFLRREGEEYRPVPDRRRREFQTWQYQRFFGSYLPVYAVPAVVPEGATHARIVLKHQNETQSWFGRSVANWGDILLDNLMVWQQPSCPVKPEVAISPYAPIFSSSEILPPKVPVGNFRENSVTLFPVRSRTANLFFASLGETVELTLCAGNLLPNEREIRLEGRILDWEGKAVAPVSRNVTLRPYEGAMVKLSPPGSLKFGAYLVELQAFDGGRKVGDCVLRFGLLPAPNTVSDEERFGKNYPFDFHPTGIGMDDESSRDPAMIDFQLGILRLMGVRGIRLQSRFHGLKLDDPAASAAGARQKVERWRKFVLPLMRKHRIRGWVSMMEQGKNNLPEIPRSEREYAAWREYFRAQAQALGEDVEFMIFGNEGLGHHTAALKPDDPLFPKSAFAGTTREWFKLYKAAREAVKSVAPNLPFGPGQASDLGADIAKKFIAAPETGNQFDCWAFNAYGSSGQMAQNIYNVVRRPGVFCAIPEVGVAVPVGGIAQLDGERRQANALVQTHLSILGRAPWVRHIAWFTMTGGDGGEGHNVFDQYWTPRPAALAYLQMTALLGGGKVIDHRELPGGGEFFVWRKNNGTLVGVGWSASEQIVSFDVTAPLTVMDLFGNRREMVPQGGVVNIHLGPDVRYITGAPHLEFSRQLEFLARNGFRGTDPVTTLKITNNTKKSVKLNVEVLTHPLVRVSPRRTQVAVAPGAAETLVFKLNILRQDDRRRVPVQFAVKSDDGMAFHVKTAHTFARCVKAPENFRLDGSWRGWERAMILHADQEEQVEYPDNITRWQGADDVSAEILTMWDESYFYLGAKVKDNVFFAQQTPALSFLNDSLEIGVDPEHKLSNTAVWWQLGAARHLDGTASLYQFLPVPAGTVKGATVLVTPTGENGNAEYRIAIPWAALGDFKPAPGREIGFGVIVDDSDGKPGDRKFISWFGGGISSRRPQDFGDLILVE